MKLPILSLIVALAVPAVAQDAKPAEAKTPTAKPVDNKVAIKNVTADEAEKLIKDTPGLTVVDVRSPEEFEHQHIKGAVNIDINGTEFAAEMAKLDPAKPILIHCAAGSRSGRAVKKLVGDAKFQQIFHMNEGFSGWLKAGKPFEGKPLPKPEVPKPSGKPGVPPAAK